METFEMHRRKSQKRRGRRRIWGRKAAGEGPEGWGCGLWVGTGPWAVGSQTELQDFPRTAFISQ